MSYSAPIPAECCLCSEDATDDPNTVAVGRLLAHSECAEREDVYDIERCVYCGVREMTDDTAAWIDASDGRCCAECAKDMEAADPIANAVRADRLRRPEATMLQRMIAMLCAAEGATQ